MSKMIQIRNVPDDLHKAFKIRAAQEGMSLSDYLLREMRNAAAKPTLREFFHKLAQRKTVELKDSAVNILRNERDR